MSALTVVNIPLYNYRSGGVHRKHLGIYIGWEDDGMLAGYSGCDISFPGVSHHLCIDYYCVVSLQPTVALAPSLLTPFCSLRCHSTHIFARRLRMVHQRLAPLFAHFGSMAMTRDAGKTMKSVVVSL